MVLQENNKDSLPCRLDIHVSELNHSQAQQLVDKLVQSSAEIAPDAHLTGKITIGHMHRWSEALKKALISKEPFELWRIILVFLICWLPYVFVCFPGNITSDSGTGITDFLKITNYTPNNPWFQNLIMGGFSSFGKWIGNPDFGVFIYCFLQMALEIIVLSIIIRDTGRKSKAAGYCLLCLYCLNPLFPLYAFQMGKDSNFGLAVMAYVMFALKGVHDNEFWDRKKETRLFAFSIVLLGLFRNLSGWIPAIAFALYTLLAVKKKSAVKTAAAVLAALVITSVLPSAFGVPKASRQENMSMPMQTMAYYATQHPEEMTEEDQAIISQVYNYDKMLQRYNPEISDPIKNHAVFDNTTTLPYMRLWLRKFLTHPLTMLEGWWKSTDKYIIPTRMCTIKIHVAIGYMIANSAKKSLKLYNDNPHLNDVSSYVSWWLNTPVLELLVKIGLYTLLLLLMVILVIVFRQPRYFLALAPLLMILAGCLLSPVNGYYRYAYSMIASIPIVLADLVMTIMHTERIQHDTKRKRKAKTIRCIKN